MADERDLVQLVPGLTHDEQRRFDALLVAADANGEEATFECWICRDSGFTSREFLDRIGQRCSVARPCQGSEVVLCRRGLAVEAGLWAKSLQAKRSRDAVYVLGKQEPHRSQEEILAAYRERLRSHPHGGHLRVEVDRILAQEGKS